jgi:hypothetical protein
MLAFLMVASTAASLVILVGALRLALAQMREGSATRRKSKILEKLATHAALGNQSTALRALAARDPRAVEHALRAFIPPIRGYQSQRLVELEVLLGFEAHRFKYRTSQRLSPRLSENSSYKKPRNYGRNYNYSGAPEFVRLILRSFFCQRESRIPQSRFCHLARQAGTC